MTQSVEFKINIPTPVMAGVRTPIRQFASCVLVDSDDTLPSIFSSPIWLLVDMLPKEQVSVSMQVELEVSIVRIRGGEDTTHRCHSFP